MPFSHTFIYTVHDCYFTHQLTLLTTFDSDGNGPTGLKVEWTDDTSLTLSWDLLMDAVTTYMVHYASATSRYGITCEPALFTLETKDPSIAITGLSQNVSYSLYVSAVRAAAQGMFSYM